MAGKGTPSLLVAVTGGWADPVRPAVRRERADGHLAGYAQLRGCSESKGIPLAGPAVLVSGIGIVAAGIGVIVGVWADLAALGIAVFLFFTAFFIHAFWREHEPMGRITEMTQFQKDLALLGAALVILAVNVTGGDFGPCSRTRSSPRRTRVASPSRGHR
jgi:putative oxidoreductase